MHRLDLGLGRAELDTECHVLPVPGQGGCCLIAGTHDSGAHEVYCRTELHKLGFLEEGKPTHPPPLSKEAEGPQLQKPRLQGLAGPQAMPRELCGLGPGTNMGNQGSTACPRSLVPPRFHSDALELQGLDTQCGDTAMGGLGLRRMPRNMYQSGRE